MELIYVFIKNYKGIIKNKGYNFGGQFLYTYKDEVLIKEINNNYLRDFFGEKINNLTAIIGQNGSGKSTILNFIIDNLVTNRENSLNLKDEAIIVVKENEVCKVLAHSDIIIKNESNFHVVRYSTDKSSNKLDKHIGNDTSIVKFSNVFDLYDYNWRAGGNYIDISTNYLLKNSKNINEDEHENEAIDQLELFRMNEIYKQIEFVYNNDIEDLFDFKLPSKIEIELNEFDYLNSLDDLENYIEELFNSEELYCEDANEVSEKISEKIREELKQGTKKEMFDKELIVLLIENILYTLHQMKTFKDFNGQKVIRKDLESIENSIIKILYNIYNESEKIFNLLSQIFNYSEEKDLESKSIKKKYSSVDYIIDIIEDSKRFYDYIKDNCLQFVKDNKIILDEEQKINKFIEYYKQVFIFVPLLNIKWGELSSGQTALLSLYSRFYHSRASYKTNNIILIDEGELYFHPEWQRKLINNLMQNLPEIMRNEKKEIKIQIICSSNSPFLITDLPKNNVIFLDENNKTNMIMYNNKIKNTFGANIHELLSNVFFLKNTIGEFALMNIKEVAKDLTEKSREEILSIDGRKERIDYIIKNVGEPVIKRKLEDMYRTTFPNDKEDYNVKVEKLEKEKKELEESLKEKGINKIENIMKLLNNAIKELQTKADDNND